VPTDSNSHAARPVHLIITMIKWIQTSGWSIKNSSLSADGGVRPPPFPGVITLLREGAIPPTHTRSHLPVNLRLKFVCLLIKYPPPPGGGRGVGMGVGGGGGIGGGDGDGH